MGQFIIEYTDKKKERTRRKGIKIGDLEAEGLGRRANCQRCETKIPRQADLACGSWGVFGDKARVRSLSLKSAPRKV